MDNIVDITTKYEHMSLPDKIAFFDSAVADHTQSIPGNNLHIFLKKIILNNTENAYIRRKALEIHTDFVILGKIKTRQALSILIDEWNENTEINLETRRLKDLFFFYESDPKEIEEIYLKCTDNPEAEIKAEAFYNLGLITFQKGLNSEVETGLSLFEKSNQYFSKAIESIENRIDAEFFQNVVIFIIDVINNKFGKLQETINKIENLLLISELFNLNSKYSPCEISFYRALLSLSKQYSESPAEWLNFREGFQKLHYFFCEIKNGQLKSRLLLGPLKNDFEDYVQTNFLEPYYLLNLSAEKIRINALLSEYNSMSEEFNFLTYINQLLLMRPKKKVPIETLRSKLISCFPHKNRETIVAEFDKIENPFDPHNLLNLFTKLNSYNITNFTDSLITSCIKLQKSKFSYNLSEDDRNTYIADLLDNQGFLSKDQTRWGQSRTGKQSGEIDILIRENDGKPFSIIEAFIIGSLTKEYIDLHLIKIFNYDTTGLRDNFILVYSEAKNFIALWNKYIEYIPKIDYKYDFLGFSENTKYKYTDIKLGTSKHNRNGQEINLHHVFINMYYKN